LGSSHTAGKIQGYRYRLDIPGVGIVRLQMQMKASAFLEIIQGGGLVDANHLQGRF
jgi:hypothetical protein